MLQDKKYEEVVIKEEVHEFEMTDTDCTVQGTEGEFTTIITVITVIQLRCYKQVLLCNCINVLYTLLLSNYINQKALSMFRYKYLQS